MTALSYNLFSFLFSLPLFLFFFFFFLLNKLFCEPGYALCPTNPHVIGVRQTRTFRYRDGGETLRTSMYPKVHIPLLISYSTSNAMVQFMLKRGTGTEVEVRVDR